MRHKLMMHSTSNSNNEVLWRKFWKIQMPPKIQVIMWKVCHNIIPVLKNLQKKGMEVKQIWRAVLPEAELGSLFNDCYLERWSYWMKNLSASNLRLAEITCWALWNDHNALINKKKIPEAPIKRRIPRVNAWRPPPLGCVVKMNTDAAVSTEGSGVGVLLRDGNAEIVAAMIDFHVVKTPLLTEILAIREGLRLATRLGVHRVMVESDSLEALNLIGDK
ncbi:uncharacterized protein LOC111022426 [Momordica charantia]|uniref:Uncharacterized protein LOC111022426 n=1 Tax=Momordica charantia TaxID=3673 RepID=A0A6J1DPU1_MOMCH|nr:uncharacterized protein LOC111022426 [Momordica charantia]